MEAKISGFSGSLGAALGSAMASRQISPIRRSTSGLPRLNFAIWAFQRRARSRAAGRGRVLAFRHKPLRFGDQVIPLLLTFLPIKEGILHLLRILSDFLRRKVFCHILPVSSAPMC